MLKWATKSNSQGFDLESEFYGRPLYEVDPFLLQDTFCAIGRKYGRNYVYRFSASKSFGLFNPVHPVRRAAVCIYTNAWFDVIIITTILLNCLMLAFESYIEVGRAQSFYESWAILPISLKLEMFILTIYSIETSVKSIAKGFVLNQWAYLRNSGNALDFAILVLSFMNLALIQHLQTVPESGLIVFVGYTRPFTVLRIVRIIHLIPGLNTIVDCLFHNLVKLVEVMALNIFTLMIIALIALQVFMGSFRNRCVLKTTAPQNPNDPLFQLKWLKWSIDPSNHALRRHGHPYVEPEPCGNRSTNRQCLPGYTCLEGVGPNYGFGWTGFDTFSMSLLTTFQLLTLDFWEQLFDLVVSTASGWSLIFLLIVVFFGAFFLLNLLLAVVSQGYDEHVHKNQEEQRVQNSSLFRTASMFEVRNAKALTIKIMKKYEPFSYRERYSKVVQRREDETAKKGNLTNVIMMLLGKEHILTLDPEDSVAEEAELGDKYYGPDVSAVPSPAKSKKLIKALPTYSNRSLGKDFPLETSYGRIWMFIRQLVTSGSFDAAINIIIVLNTIVLASEHHRQPLWLEHMLAETAYAFVAIFTTEATLKIIGQRRKYFDSKWNTFDLFIVIISIVDVATPTEYNMTMFRAFRVLRILKLAHTWITMRVLLNIIAATLGALMNLVVVLLIVLFIFALFGIKILGSYYVADAFNGTLPRFNFQNISYSFMMTFRVLCGEWIEPMIECFQATGHSGASSQYLCVMFFIPGLIVCNFLVLNLFLAVLLASFDTENLKKMEHENKKTETIKKVVNLMFTKHKRYSAKDHARRQSESNISIVSSESKGKKRFKKAVSSVILLLRKEKMEKLIEAYELKQRDKKVTAVKLVKTKQYFNDSLSRKYSKARRTRTWISILHMGDDEVSHCLPSKCFFLNACCCNGVRNGQNQTWMQFRLVASRIVSHSMFDWILLSFIFTSSLTCCFQDVYLSHDSPRGVTILYLEYCTLVFFCVEALLKIIAIGFWKYFTSTWTLLDFVVLTVSILDVSPVDSEKLRSLRVLRVLHAFRPLRAISRWQGMKIVVNAIMFAIPAIFNVLLVCLVFWLIFAIMGVQLFKGQFYKCVDSKGVILDILEVGNRTQCCELAAAKNYSWINQVPNFDNVFMSYLTLLQVATFEGWVEAMFASADARGVDQQPSRDDKMVHLLFYIVFVLFGSFFTLNLFIGVIIDNFNRLKKQYEGSLAIVLLTNEQRNYYLAMKKLSRVKPKKVIYRPKNELLGVFYDTAVSYKSEVIMIVIIVLNMIVMAVDIYRPGQMRKDLIECLNLYFSTLCWLEAFIKIMGLRQYYFHSFWNIFDFSLVVLGIAEFIADELETGFNRFSLSSVLRVLRIARIGRMLRLIKVAKGIRTLLFTLLISLPALFNIGALLALLTFMYAIMGMALFGKTALNGVYDDLFNFRTFFSSCLVLVRVMTDAGWNEILAAFTVIPPECGTYQKLQCGHGGHGALDDCPNFYIAVLYFVSFLLLTFILIINMYIAVILENYNETCKEAGIGIVDEDIEGFYSKWALYDPEATQFIRLEDLSTFLNSLDAPMRISNPNMLAIALFNLPIARGNKVHCLDVIYALTRHVVGDVENTEELRKLQDQIEHEYVKQFPPRRRVEIISSTRVWWLQHNSAKIIQRAWKEYRWRSNPRISMITAAKKRREASRSFDKFINAEYDTVMAVTKRLNSSQDTRRSSNSRPKKKYGK